VRLEPPNSAAAQWCLEQYFAELSVRFEVGFDPARSNPARSEEMTSPHGFFVVAWLNGAPAGCGALKIGDEGSGEVKRMWTAPTARGLGIARRVLRSLEAKAREAGLMRLRLETNRTLQEAQALYHGEGYREVAPFNAEPYLRPPLVREGALDRARCSPPHPVAPSGSWTIEAMTPTTSVAI
jgi:GNAT superfamily N-acetyltransferase